MRIEKPGVPPFASYSVPGARLRGFAVFMPGFLRSRRGKNPSYKPMAGEIGVPIPHAIRLILQVLRRIGLVFPGEIIV